MKLRIAVDGVPFDVELERRGDEVRAVVEGKETRVRVEPRPDGSLTASAGGTARRLVFVDERTVELDGRRVAFNLLAFDARAADTSKGAGDGTLRPPMPGAIARLLVREGQSVPQGAPLVVLEAMKMQNEIVAPFAGTIRKVHVKQGDTVTLRDVVLELERRKD